MRIDYIVVGAGFAGATIAERIASKLNKKVLIIEKRGHIGGNCYDYYDEHGLLIHKYGPHIFHTNHKEVWEYLSNFTDWRPYRHRVLAYIDGKKVPLPFNLNSLYALFPEALASKLEEKLIDKFGFGKKIPILELLKTEDTELKQLADFVYRKVFLNYTMKQWGLKPEELNPEVTARVPVHLSRSDDYFQDKYQGIPADGYTQIFKRMLSHPNINIMLKTDALKLLRLGHGAGKILFQGKEFQGKVIYTGPIDELLGFKFGELGYRSLKFELEIHDREFFQEVAVVNYPNDYRFTRITEFKHMTGQKHPKTVIAKEYPQEYRRNVPGMDIPYYPIPEYGELKKYSLYQKEISRFKDKIILIGRLAEYKYYSMNMVLKAALEIFEERIK